MLKRNNLCYYCGEKLNIDTSTIDHKFPRSKGGSDTRDNRVLACLKCNGKKADKLALWGTLIE